MLFVIMYTDLLFINNSLLYMQGPEQENTSAKWSRAPPPPLNPQIDTLAFQQIEIDHYIGNNIFAYLNNNRATLLKML